MPKQTKFKDTNVDQNAVLITYEQTSEKNDKEIDSVRCKEIFRIIRFC